ncbi:MAG TPA: nitroreductase family deazaflavin-dependent oxidoreductase [Terriglobales bacterium]|nr:nitroreductase family deazaflavin-dependent oxidoreductase [Terriglobales bacterium]
MPQKAPPSYLYLTTTGRRTGLPREIEIWYTCREGLYYVIAEFASSHWVQNIQANPRVTVRLGNKRLAASARIIDAHAQPDLHAAVRQLSSDKYGWGDGLIVELRPEGPPSAQQA